MVQFDESKVISPLHTEKAEIGKKYYYNDSLKDLKQDVLNNKTVRTLRCIDDSSWVPFLLDELQTGYQFLYPYEEPPKQRMTKRQLAEWISRGNGEYSNKSTKVLHYNEYSYCAKEENEKVEDDGIIRPWGSEEWIEPTTDIYERDCKKEN